MRKIILVAVVLSLVLFTVVPAAADSYTFGASGLGSLMKSPVVYSGVFLFGVSGTWEFQIDDSLWPDPADSTARFDYIWDTFFVDNYDSTTGAESWFGYFSGSTLPTAPTFDFNLTAPAGQISGDISFVILMRDWYADGILDQSEKHRNNQIAGTLILSPELGVGFFADHCGDGSMSAGNFNFVNPPLDDSVTFMGQFSSEFCGSPVEDSSWGNIKALYK